MDRSSPLLPIFYGYVSSTQDALLLFEACLCGTLSHVARRPHDHERAGLIKSGNVFIYEEHSAGIKRWTDGVPWSPSRILGDFLVYRELDKQFRSGQKRRAIKRFKKPLEVRECYGSNRESGSAFSSVPSSASSNSLCSEAGKSLVGSLVSSYNFRKDGLVKKTMSVTVRGVSHHLVSYYTVDDIMNKKFITPTCDARFQHLVLRPELLAQPSLRTPTDRGDSVDSIGDRAAATSSYSYGTTNQGMSDYPILPPPRPAPSYAQPSTLFNYNVAPPMPSTSGRYENGSRSSYNNPPKIQQPPSLENMNYRYHEQQGHDSIGAGTPKVSHRSPNLEYGDFVDIGGAAVFSQPQQKLYSLQSNPRSCYEPIAGIYQATYSIPAPMRMAVDMSGAAATSRPGWINDSRDGLHSGEY